MIFFLKRMLPWAMALAGFIWLARDFNGHLLKEQWTHLDWRWVSAAVAFDVLSYVCQGFRWSSILGRTGQLPPARATLAIYIGLFANEILPLRAGEVLRTCVAARWLRTSAPVVAPSLFVERFLDGCWLAVATLITAHLLHFEGLLAQAEHLLYLMVAGGAVLLAIGLPLVGRFPRLRRFAETTLSLAGKRRLAGAAMWSLLLLACQFVSFWMAMRSCGILLPLWAGCAAQTIVRLGTMVPAAPANVGTYQLFCTMALTMLGVPQMVAASFSITVFLMLTFPLWLVGGIALLSTGMSFSELRQAKIDPAISLP